MSTYRISYVMTTYNKLPYLKHVLGRLVAERRPDEEIVVADGGSKDGTADYLRELYEAGKIQQYVSEHDKGQSHGMNKCLFMARGEIIKLINDDDAFYYPAIRQAADFMMENPEVDVVMGYNAASQMEDLSYVRVKEDPARDYQRWLEHKIPFQMIDLPILIRRKSLTLTGIFYAGVVMVDLEWVYRATSLNVNIAWCTAVISMHVSNPDGNFNRMSEAKRTAEFVRVRDFYAGKPPRRSVGEMVREGIEAAKRPIRPIKRALFDRMNLPQYQNPERFETGFVPRPGENNIDATYRMCDEMLAKLNENRPVHFTFRKQEVRKVFNPDQP
jgi:glycosyltransferase involved in cell wall biosynthesis